MVYSFYIVSSDIHSEEWVIAFLNILSSGLLLHTNTFIPGKMYCSGLKEEGQVPLHYIGTFLCSLIIFASTTFCAFSLPSSPVPSSLGLWEPSYFLFLFCCFFLPVCIYWQGLRTRTIQVFICSSPVLSVCFHLCIHAFDLNQYPGYEYPAVCRVLLRLPAESSGLGLDWCQAVCGVVSTIFYLVPERVPACTQTVLYYRTCPRWKDCRNDI